MEYQIEVMLHRWKMNMARDKRKLYKTVSRRTLNDKKKREKNELMWTMNADDDDDDEVVLGIKLIYQQKKNMNKWHFINEASAVPKKKRQCFEEKKDCRCETRHDRRGRFVSCLWRRRFNEQATKQKLESSLSEFGGSTQHSEYGNLYFRTKSTKKYKNEKWIYDV